MVLQRQGANVRKVRARQPRLVALAEHAITLGEPLIQPQLAYRVLKIQQVQQAEVILEGSGDLRGSTVARKLTGTAFAVVMIATVGPKIEREILRNMQENAPLGLALDGYATAVVGVLIVAFRRYLAKLAGKEHLGITTPLYPGTHGWELAAAQSQLFSFVDAARIGVELTSSFLMTPCKSVSMLIGVGAGMKHEQNPCEECDVAATCRYRSSDA